MASAFLVNYTVFFVSVFAEVVWSK